MDTVPYYSDFELVRFLDRECLTGEMYELSDEQFYTIVKIFNMIGTKRGVGMED